MAPLGRFWHLILQKYLSEEDTHGWEQKGWEVGSQRCPLLRTHGLGSARGGNQLIQCLSSMRYENRAIPCSLGSFTVLLIKSQLFPLPILSGLHCSLSSGHLPLQDISRPYGLAMPWIPCSKLLTLAIKSGGFLLPFSASLPQVPLLKEVQGRAGSRAGHEDSTPNYCSSSPQLCCLVHPSSP